GNLDVTLLNVDAFVPSLGDEFTILTAVGGVSGQFQNSPVSWAAGKQFHWTVLYHPNDVTLRLDSITVPEPASVMLAALAALVWCGGRRRIRRATGLAILGLVAAHSSSALAVDKSWIAGDGVWGSPNSWAPLGVPGPADIALIGNIAG